jgi:hypothetical protein
VAKDQTSGGIRKPKVYTDGTIKYNLLTTSGEPYNFEEALHNKDWKQAMDDEFEALIKNKTWHHVLHIRVAILLIVNGFTKLKENKMEA